MGSPERPKANIIKKAVKIAIPAALAVSQTACITTVDVNFPDCAVDSQTKRYTEKIDYGAYYHYSPFSSRVAIDGVIFELDIKRPDQINLSGETNGRVKILEENKHYKLDDRNNGRHYEIVFSSEPDTKMDVSDPKQGASKVMDIDASCNTGNN